MSRELSQRSRIIPSRPQLMHSVEDGIITGNVERNRQECGHCRHTTVCIHIHSVQLPEGIKSSNALIAYTYVDASRGRLHHKPGRFEPIQHIGIGCGCYARFHRQIAHISHRRDHLPNHLPDRKD